MHKQTPHRTCHRQQRERGEARRGEARVVILHTYEVQDSAWQEACNPVHTTPHT